MSHQDARGPIVCDLSQVPVERREHFFGEIRTTLRRASAVHELADGFAIEFPSEDGIVAGLGEIVEYDRRCCPFIRHAVISDPSGGAIRLELTGVEEGRAALAAELQNFLPQGLTFPSGR